MSMAAHMCFLRHNVIHTLTVQDQYLLGTGASV